MTSSNKLLLLLLLTVTACTPAKSPLGDRDGDASFQIISERMSGSAELIRASARSFGRAQAQKLHLTVCLQSVATGQPVANGTRFAIRDGAGHEIEREITTGCLHWDEEHELQPVAAQRNLRLERTIRALDKNHRGVVTAVFNVKPWIEGEGAVQGAMNREQFADAVPGPTAFADGYPSTTGAASAAEISEHPHLAMAGNHFELNYVSNGLPAEFEVDRFLNLAVPFRYTFSFQPLIARQLFSGGMQAEPVTTGRVRVTLVFFASAQGDPRHDDRYLTSAQVEADVQANGLVTETFVLKYPHMLFASGRQTLLVQMSPVGQTGVEGRSFVATVAYKDTLGPLTLLPDRRDAAAIHADAIKERQRRAGLRRSPLEEYVASHDLIRVSVDDFPTEATRAALPYLLRKKDVMLTREELAFALTTDALDTKAYRPTPSRGVAEKLCRLFLRPQAPATAQEIASASVTSTTDVGGTDLIDYQCSADSLFSTEKDRVSRRLSIRHLDFVETLADRIPRNVVVRSYANQDFGVYYSHDQSRVGIAGIGLKGNLGPFLGELARTNMTTVSKRGTFGQSQSMAIDSGSLEAFASVRSCILVTGLRKPFRSKPWLICSPRVSPPAWHAEQFFYYSQIFGSNHSPFIDPFAVQSGFKMLVRGAKRMMRLTQTLEAADFKRSGFETFIEYHPQDPSAMDTLDKLDVLTDQDAPGAFSRY